MISQRSHCLMFPTPELNSHNDGNAYYFPSRRRPLLLKSLLLFPFLSLSLSPQANARAADRQHMVEQLKRELARAHKALLRELGDVPLAKALDEGAGGWRGRAQEISLLKVEGN